MVGCRPKGAWLTERVWESSVVPALADAGIEYVTVDDYHFLCTGRGAEELGGYFSTEEDGRSLDLFPISEALRYRIPFSPATEAVAFIERQAQSNPGAAAIYFDDIEKFGIWPETYEWVYEKGWLQQFIEAVLSSSAVRTQHFDEYRAGSAEPRGGLPADHLVHRDERMDAARGTRARLCPPGQAGAGSRPLRARQGVPARRHLAQLPVALQRSELDAQAHAGAVCPARSRCRRRRGTGRLRELLYRAQANDAYWHGLFGGLYLPHLRRAVYNALVELEGALDRIAPRPADSRLDADMDGVDEVFVHNEILQLVVRCDSDAAIIELDSYSLRHNFGDTLRRRQEHYYRKMHVGEHQHFQGEGIASAHDRVSFKHAIAPADVVPDPRPRGLFLDLWRRGDHAACASLRCSTRDRRSSSRAAVTDWRSRRRIQLSDNRVTVRYRCVRTSPGASRPNSTWPCRAATACSAATCSKAGSPAASVSPSRLPSMTMLSLEDGVLGGMVGVLCSPPAALDAGPHHTVSQSEDGFEKIMQAVTLRLAWNVEAGRQRHHGRTRDPAGVIAANSASDLAPSVARP